MLWLLKINFHGFRRFPIHGNSCYIVLYTQCLRYNICSTWFLDIKISTCLHYVCLHMGKNCTIRSNKCPEGGLLMLLSYIKQIHYFSSHRIKLNVILIFMLCSCNSVAIISVSS